MRRLLVMSLLAAAIAAFAVVAAGAGQDGEGGRSFTMEVDNAFGLVEGADLKVAGVRAGRITGMRLDRRTKRALVDFEIDKTGFGSLREDVFCETRPQSLIGEYYVDCRPGTSPKALPEGSVIPVSRTASTVPLDLINNIMRRPERERLRIILNEIGAGVGARGDQLNETIRRASPALRETDKVLATLARQNTVLRDLAEDADAVITELASNKRDVSRWVRETRETAAASAERRDDIAASFSKLPEFLRQLRPTMAELGRTARGQAPALRDLEASAGQLERLFTNLEPFAKASEANLGALGQAAEKGRPAVKAALPVVEQLETFSRDVPEAARNARFITADMDDRSRAVEKDPRSPGGQGYTGFEAILQYLYDQALSINIFDANGYILKANLFHSECSEYQNAESLKAHMAEDPEFFERCRSNLGPNQQGITVPDPTASRKPAARRKKARRKKAREERPAAAPEAPRAEPPAGRPAKPELPVKPPIDLGQTLEDLLDGKLPDLLGGGNAKLPAGLEDLDVRGDEAAQTALLDFLFGS